MKWQQIFESGGKDAKVDSDIAFVSSMFYEITGYVDIGWEWQEDGSVIIYNSDSWGRDIPSDMWAIARLIERLSGWTASEVTSDEGYDQYGDEPFKVALHK